MMNFIYCNSSCGAAKASAPSTIFVLTDCWHIFCVNCFRAHTKRNKGCPVCKHQPLKGLPLTGKCPPAYQAYFFKPLDAVKKTIQREKKHHVFQKTQIKGYRRFILYKVSVAKREEQAKEDNIRRVKEAERNIAEKEKERDNLRRCVKSLDTEGGAKGNVDNSVGNKQELVTNRVGERTGVKGQPSRQPQQKEQNLTGNAHANDRNSGMNRQRDIINSSNVQRQPSGVPQNGSKANVTGSRPPAANQRRNEGIIDLTSPVRNTNLSSTNPRNQPAPRPMNPRAHHQPSVSRDGNAVARNPSCGLQKTATGSNLQPSTRELLSKSVMHQSLNNNQRPMASRNGLQGPANPQGDIKRSNVGTIDPRTLAARASGPTCKAGNARMIPPPANTQRQGVPARANQPVSRDPNNGTIQSAANIQRQVLASRGGLLNGGAPQRDMMPPPTGTHIQSLATRQREAASNNIPSGRIQPSTNIQHQRLAGRPNPYPIRNPSAVVQPVATQRQTSLVKGSETSGGMSSHASKSILSGASHLQANPQQRNSMFENAPRNPQSSALQSGSSNQQQHYAQNRAQPIGDNNQNLTRRTTQQNRPQPIGDNNQNLTRRTTQQNRAQPIGDNNQNLTRRTTQQNPMATVGANQLSGIRQPQINRQAMGGPVQRSTTGTNVYSMGSGRLSAVNPTSTAMPPPAPMPKSYFRKADQVRGTGTSALTRPNGGSAMSRPAPRTLNIDIGFSSNSFKAVNLNGHRVTAENEQLGTYSPPPSSSRATTGWD